MALTKVIGEGIGTLTDDITIPDKIIHSGDTDTAIRFSAANTVSIETAGVENIKFDNSAVVVNNGGANIDFRVEGDTQAELFFIDAGSDFVGIGHTNYYSGKLSIFFDADSDNERGITLTPQNNTCTYLHFHNAGASTVGSISGNGSNTAFNTSSDYRLKENIEYDWDATTRLKQLKPARFNWIADDTNTTQDGFIAHEVSNIIPEAITGQKDATEKYIDDKGDEQTKIVPQGIDQSKLVPLLTKTLQEALTEIDTLKTKVAALESK